MLLAISTAQHSNLLAQNPTIVLKPSQSFDYTLKRHFAHKNSLRFCRRIWTIKVAANTWYWAIKQFNKIELFYQIVTRFSCLSRSVFTYEDEKFHYSCKWTRNRNDWRKSCKFIKKTYTEVVHLINFIISLIIDKLCRVFLAHLFITRDCRKLESRKFKSTWKWSKRRERKSYLMFSNLWVIASGKEKK